MRATICPNTAHSSSTCGERYSAGSLIEFDKLMVRDGGIILVVPSTNDHDLLVECGRMLANIIRHGGVIEKPQNGYERVLWLSGSCAW